MKESNIIRDFKVHNFIKLLNDNDYYYLRRGKGSHVIYYNNEMKKKFAFAKKSGVIPSAMVWNFLRNYAKEEYQSR